MEFTSETFDRCVEKLFRRCCCCHVVRPRLRVAHHFLGIQCMSKRAGTASTHNKLETGSRKKRQRADWSPAQPGEKFCYTYTGQQTLRLSVNDLLKVAGRVFKVCGESWEMLKIQQHIGAHILQEHWKQWPSKTRPRYPCGLCGLQRALRGDPTKAQDEAVSGCYMWIDQNGKKAMHECKLLGSVPYNLSTSGKCALSMPCTNRPFKC